LIQSKIIVIQGAASMISKRPTPAWLAACVVLAACTSKESKTGAASAESHAPGTTTALIAGPCAAYPKGSPGVINAFCDGPATVNLTVGDKSYALRGGTCVTQANLFSLNLGVVAGADLAGPKPDYVGLTVAAPQGPFTNGVLMVVIDGKAYPLIENSGEVGPAGGRFEGVAATSGARISGSFAC
jgi:hypothetical protein